MLPGSTAYIDESIQLAGDGFYVVAAAVIIDRAEDDLRTRLLRLTPGGRRFHWRTEQGPQRRAMESLLCELPAGSLSAYVASPCPQKQAERARRKCLEPLLTGTCITLTRSLVLESRQDHNDAKDRSFIAGLIRSGACPPQLTYRHTRPQDEPLLWLADALAGIVSSAAVRHDPTLLEPIRESVRIQHVTL